MCVLYLVYNHLSELYNCVAPTYICMIIDTSREYHIIIWISFNYVYIVTFIYLRIKHRCVISEITRARPEIFEEDVLKNIIIGFFSGC